MFKKRAEYAQDVHCASPKRMEKEMGSKDTNAPNVDISFNQKEKDRDRSGNFGIHIFGESKASTKWPRNSDAAFGGSGKD